MNLANQFSHVKHSVSTREAHEDGVVTVGRGPIADFAVDADRTTRALTINSDHTVSVINADTLAVEGTVAVGGEPFSVVVTEDRAYVGTTSPGHDSITVVDITAMAVIRSYPLAFSVTALAVSPDGKRVYIGRAGSDHVDIAVIDTTAERVGTIDVAKGLGISIDALRVTGDGRRVYAAISDNTTSGLMVINAETARVNAAVRLGSPIRDLALGPDNSAFVLTSDRTSGGVVHIVDLAAHTVTDTVELGGAPTRLALNPDGSRVYVVDYDEVAVLSALTGEMLDTVAVGAQPSAVAVTAGGARLFVADYSGEVTAFSVESTTPLDYPPFLAVDPMMAAAMRELEPVGV